MSSIITLPVKLGPVPEDEDDDQNNPNILKLQKVIGSTSDGIIPVYLGQVLNENYTVKIVTAQDPIYFAHLQWQINQNYILFPRRDPLNIILQPFRTGEYKGICFVLFPVMKTSLRFILQDEAYATKGFLNETVTYILYAMVNALCLLHENDLHHLEMSAGHIYIDSYIEKFQLKLGFASTVYDCEILKENDDWDSVPRSHNKNKADIYLLGITALELIYGHYMFRGNRKWVIDKIVWTINKTGKLPPKPPNKYAPPTFMQKVNSFVGVNKCYGHVPG